MTFYEAALRVLEEAGMPLHSTEITKRAVEKGFLSHVGKTPEITMLSRLAAMAKRPRDRKLQVTDAKDTFALTDWMLPENPEALAATGVQEPNPEEALPPLRPAERHPEAHAEYLRSIGRQNDRKRRDDDRKKKFPPVAEVACEVLQEAQTSLAVAELLARIKQRDGAADDLPSSRLIDGLALDNQKRLDEGRKPLFAAVRSEQNELQISLEPQAEGGPSALEVQTAFCLACKLPFENGRVVLKSEQRQQQGEAAVAPPSADDVALFQNARHAGKDARKAMARILRTKLAALELGTFEKSCVRMLHALHFRELKVARRSKEGPLMTARRREGSLEIRYAVRILKGGGTVERKHIQDLRRELSQNGANVGLLITAAEARGDARSECTSGPLVMMWAGDALAEKFFEAKVGVSVTTIELYEIDEAFFAQAKIDAEESAKRREDRQRERDQRPGSTPPASNEGTDQAAAAPAADQAAVTVPDGVPAVAAAAPADANAEEGDDGEEGDEGDDEGEEGAEGGDEAAPGAPGEGKRRRRRRRRRRRGGQGGAPRPEGVTVEGGQPAAPATTPPVTLAQPNESTTAEPAPVAPSPSAPPLDPGPSS